MGPLVPDIVSTDLNFIVALIIGVFFGFILEQAGFSSSRKLVGLFYGYDFTVLRVFFTAGIVAMVGVMSLEYFGMIDIQLVYINPTFLWSALIGGLIMGLGFVVGGFCPGTSVCAAAIGKIDAMIFIGGSFLGVLFFAEGYPVLERLYKAEYLGNPRIFETLGTTQNIFAFLLVVVALVAFWFVSMIENKVNGIVRPAFRYSPYYVGLALVGLAVAVSAFLIPDRKTALLDSVRNETPVWSAPLKKMSVDELAFRLMDSDEKNLQVIDFRPRAEYDSLSLPKSTWFELNNLFEKEPNQVLSLRHKINVIVADDELTERRMALIAEKLGYRRLFILEGGFSEFQQQILDYRSPGKPVTRREVDLARFRSKAKSVLPVLIRENKSAGPVEKKQKRVVGGC